MNTVTLSTESLRALINVYKASLEIHQTLQLSAIDVSDEGQELWDESLDWPELGICYFDLGKAIDQAKSKVTGLEAILNTAPSSMNLKLSVHVEGQETDDLQTALAEVLRLVSNDFTSGYDRNETGSYRFLVE